jgi:hypothetical protein
LIEWIFYISEVYMSLLVCIIRAFSLIMALSSCSRSEKDVAEKNLPIVTEIVEDILKIDLEDDEKFNPPKKIDIQGHFKPEEQIIIEMITKKVKTFSLA